MGFGVSRAQCIAALLLAVCTLALLWVDLVTRVPPERVRARPRSVDIVVAAYHEPLAWLAHLRAHVPHARLFIYSKAANASFRLYAPTDSISTVLPNVGRCDHTYAHHIAEHYDDLADATLFLTASANSLPIKRATLERVLGALRADMWPCVGTFRPTWPFFTKTFYCVTAPANWDARAAAAHGAHVCPTVRAAPSPFWRWWRAHAPFGMAFPHFFVRAGVFAARGDALRSVERSVWRRFEAQLGAGDNVEAGHYMERSWYGLLSGGGGSLETYTRVAAQVLFGRY
jgi:hypothetical protein